MPLKRRTFIAGLRVLANHKGFAQSTPSSAFANRPMRIVPFGSAGGPIDSLARAYAEKLAQRWGLQVIVDAKPGASIEIFPGIMNHKLAKVLTLGVSFEPEQPPVFFSAGNFIEP